MCNFLYVKDCIIPIFSHHFFYTPVFGTLRNLLRLNTIFPEDPVDNRLLQKMVTHQVRSGGGWIDLRPDTKTILQRPYTKIMRTGKDWVSFI